MIPNDEANCSALIRLVLDADVKIKATEIHKFPLWLHEKLTSAIVALEPAGVSADAAESARAEHSRLYQDAIERGRSLISEVNAILDSLRRLNTASLKTLYGLNGGISGKLTQARVEQTLRQFASVQDNPNLPAAAKLSDTLMADVESLLTEIDTHKTPAQSGARQSATAQKRAALADAKNALSRAKSYLDAALPEASFDPALAAYGFTPRRRRPSAT